MVKHAHIKQILHPLLLNTRFITPKVGIPYTESVERKNYDKKKKTKEKRSVTQTWLDLNSVPLGCEESV